MPGAYVVSSFFGAFLGAYALAPYGVGAALLGLPLGGSMISLLFAAYVVCRSTPSKHHATGVNVGSEKGSGKRPHV